MFNKFFQPQINLLKLIQNMVQSIGGVEVNEEEGVIVSSVYLVALSVLLNETSFRTIGESRIRVQRHFLSNHFHSTIRITRYFEC